MNNAELSRGKYNKIIRANNNRNTRRAVEIDVNTNRTFGSWNFRENTFSGPLSNHTTFSLASTPLPPWRQMAFCWYFIRNVFFSQSFQRFFATRTRGKTAKNANNSVLHDTHIGFYRCRFRNNNAKNLTIFTCYLCTQILQAQDMDFKGFSSILS